MNTKRQALSLAAVLAATVVTGAAAILGLVHTPTQVGAQPTVAQITQPQEEGDG